MSRPFVAALLLLVAASARAQVRVEYRDNPRPIVLALPDADFPLARVDVFVHGPERISIQLEPGWRNPTRWARREGRAVPDPRRVGSCFGRFGLPRTSAMALYWSDQEHSGRAVWRRGTPDPERLARLAEEVEEAWAGDREGGWLAYAADLPVGSTIQLSFEGADATMLLFGGDLEEARRRAGERLQRAMASGRGWEPMLRMHSPSWVASPESFLRAVLVAGPVLLMVAGDQGAATMRRLAGLIERPLPEAPEVGEDPMGPPPPGPETPETEREKRWREREERFQERRQR